MKLTLNIHGVDVSHVDATPEAVEAMVNEIGRLNRLKLSDFDEVRHKVADLEDRLAETLVRAEDAEYVRDAMVSRCRDLEARLAEMEVPS